MDKPINSSIARRPVWPVDRKAARAAILQWRRTMPVPERTHRSERIGRLVSSWLARSKADLSERLQHPVVGVYWPIRGEPDLTGFYQQWIDLGWTIGLPRTPSQPAALSFLRYEPGVPMLSDSFGIATPAQASVVTPDRIIAPCVGYSAGCYRLGYGGGYYDRTLTGVAGMAIGVAYHETRVDAFEPQAHDQPLDAIATDTGWA